MPAHLTRLRTWLAAAVVLATLAVFVPVVTPTAEAATTPTLVFNGRGWGHGRGMSQYGAQGYATGHGDGTNWGYRKILNHYYSNTSMGSAGNPTVRIQLDAMNQKRAYNVTATSGTRIKISGDCSIVPDTHRFIRLVYRAGNGGWIVRSRASRSHDWKDRHAAGNTVTVGRCNSGGLWVNGRKYPGSVRAWSRKPGATRYFRTIAITRTETYLRGVVPNESPPSWNINALRAQAVAARSYMLAGDNRWIIDDVKYADTCDTIYCQVYNPQVTHDRTDRAIRETAGQVRRFSSGAIARTEFSSTSGGWTAGGTFPAVQDKGDSISPRHTWSTTRSAAPLENRYANGSALTSISVTQRNGLGAMGGRAVKVRLLFANGRDVTVSGNDVRSTLGLWSDWFSVGIQNSAADSYINAAYNLFVDRNATSNDLNYWRPYVAAGNRRALTDALSKSNEWAGVEIRNLYQKILDRSPDQSGYDYWLGRVRAGSLIETMAAQFYGSSEYFGRAGNTNRGYVDRLYRDLLGRPADGPGLNYWVGRIEAGWTRTAVATGFYASTESRRDRVTRLYRVVLGRGPDPSGLAHWTREIQWLGDVALAADLAASSEYYNKNT